MIKKTHYVQPCATVDALPATDIICTSDAASGSTTIPTTIPTGVESGGNWGDLKD